MLFSLGCALGTISSLSSYNIFDYDCQRDAIIVALIDTMTSVVSGFVVFGSIGFMANEDLHLHSSDTDKFAALNKHLEYAEGGKLAHIAYPYVISYSILGEYCPQFWSILVSIMFFTLGIDTLMALVETVVTTILDHFKVRFDLFINDTFFKIMYLFPRG